MDIPFCLRDYVEVRNSVGTLEGEICYHSLIAVPLARLVLRAFVTDDLPKPNLSMDTTSISVPGSTKPDILLSLAASNILCVEVKSSDGDIELAWQEAIGYSMLLPLQTKHCTVVMGVAGDTVRIGLMTLLNKETVTPNEDASGNVPGQHGESDSQLLGPLPEKLPLDLRVALQAANISPYGDTVCKRDVKVLYGIQFLAHDVNHGLFDTTISSYFAYLLQSIIDGYKNYTTSPIRPPKKNVLLYSDETATNQRVIGCPRSFAVKIMKHGKPLLFEEVHRLLQYPIYRLGTCALTRTKKFGAADTYITHILPYIPGKELGNVDASLFAELCAIVLCLHRGHSICHGDIRRPNILVGEDKHIRLIDWEYASQSDPDCLIDGSLQTKSVFDDFLDSKDPALGALIERNSFVYGCLSDIYAMFYFIWLGLTVDNNNSNISASNKKSSVNVSAPNKKSSVNVSAPNKKSSVNVSAPNKKSRAAVYKENAEAGPSVNAQPADSEMQSNTENTERESTGGLVPGSSGSTTHMNLDEFHCVFVCALTKGVAGADRQSGTKAQREEDTSFQTQLILRNILESNADLKPVWNKIMEKDFFSPAYRYNTVDGLHTSPQGTLDM